MQELREIHSRVEMAISTLDEALQELSYFYWRGGEDAPLFRLAPETNEVMKRLQDLDVPISEIEGAA